MPWNEWRFENVNYMFFSHKTCVSLKKSVLLIHHKKVSFIPVARYLYKTYFSDRFTLYIWFHVSSWRLNGLPSQESIASLNKPIYLSMFPDLIIRDIIISHYAFLLIWHDHCLYLVMRFCNIFLLQKEESFIFEMMLINCSFIV